MIEDLLILVAENDKMTLYSCVLHVLGTRFTLKIIFIQLHDESTNMPLPKPILRLKVTYIHAYLYILC